MKTAETQEKEEGTIKDFLDMCIPSINPDLYSYLVDKIIPTLRMSRGLNRSDGLCSTCQGYGFTQEICAGGSKIDHPCQDCKPRPLSGMYGETPRIQIGSLSICEMQLPPSGSVWVEEEGVDGSEFSKEYFGKFLKEWYDKNF